MTEFVILHVRCWNFYMLTILFCITEIRRFKEIIIQKKAVNLK